MVSTKIDSSGLKVTSVPVLSVVPISRTSYWGIPILYSCSKTLPALWTSTLKSVDNALTHETPTPCRPPDTLYEPLSNLPPACSTVMTTSRADLFSFSWISVGIPLPLSLTVIELSSFIKTSMFEQCPAKASSIELSTTS